MAASQNGQTELVQLLLEKGADVTVKRKDGASALSLAEEYARHETARLLRSTLGLPSTRPASAVPAGDTDAFAQAARKARTKVVQRKLATTAMVAAALQR
jgi:ankyrin repeat protein